MAIAPIAGWIAAAGVSTAVATVAATVVVGVVTGAVMGAAMSAIKGGNILQGALMGAAIGGVTAGVFSAASAGVSAIVEAGAETSAEAGVSAGIEATTNLAGDAAAGVGPLAEGAPIVGESAMSGATTEGTLASQGLLSPLENLSPAAQAAQPSIPVAGLSGGAQPATTPTTTPAPSAQLSDMDKLIAANQADSSNRMWAGVGQGAASGLGQMGAEMMKTGAAKDLSEQRKQDEIDMMNRNYSPVPYALTTTPIAMTQNPNAAYNANVTANAPSSNVTQNLQSQTVNSNVPGLLAAQTANVTQPISDWWMSHLQSLVPVPKMATAS
jgi:hypothetical protein